jgi:nucleotide-binding universal stress UspA family protein
MNIEKILIPTDFSQNAQLAFDQAYELARLVGAKLYVLHVQDENTLRMAVAEGLLSDHSTDKELENEIERLLQFRFSTMLAGHSYPEVVVEQQVIRGDTDAVIPKYAKEIGANLMVVGMHGTGILDKFKSVVLGSVAESLIEKSPCPILLIRHDQAE